MSDISNSFLLYEDLNNDTLLNLFIYFNNNNSEILSNCKYHIKYFFVILIEIFNT